jgi:hypothetical protein
VTTNVRPHKLASGWYRWQNLDIWKTSHTTWQVRTHDGRVLHTSDLVDP